MPRLSQGPFGDHIAEPPSLWKPFGYLCELLGAIGGHSGSPWGSWGSAFGSSRESWEITLDRLGESLGGAWADFGIWGADGDAGSHLRAA